jgi:hypothetical protein
MTIHIRKVTCPTNKTFASIKPIELVIGGFAIRHSKKSNEDSVAAIDSAVNFDYYVL